jgi:AbrB family looped-hinge helix DNA binding protein
MTLSIEAKIGKRFAIYIPKAIVEKLGVMEGDKIMLKLEKNKIIIETIKDPIEIALKDKKFARLTQEEVEKISLEEQKKYEGIT